MTNKEKLNYLNERTRFGLTIKQYEEFMLFGYYEELIEKGLLVGESRYKPMAGGKSIFALCQEVDLKPTNESVEQFILTLIRNKAILQEQFRPMCNLFQLYRDNKDLVIKELNKN